jgi:hypothetical protein
MTKSIDKLGRLAATAEDLMVSRYNARKRGLKISIQFCPDYGAGARPIKLGNLMILGLRGQTVWTATVHNTDDDRRAWGIGVTPKRALKDLVRRLRAGCAASATAEAAWNTLEKANKLITDTLETVVCHGSAS